MSSPRTSVLALGAFSVGTSAYVVTGLLPSLSAGLGISTSAAAQLATVFSLAYAVGSPLLAAMSGRWERRRLLVTALAVTALGNVLSAIAPSYWLLLIARVITAAGAAVFTPVGSAVAAQLLPPERRGRAVAIVFGGLTVALSIGVPAANLLSPRVGYRGVFALVALFALAGAVAVRFMLPTVSAPAVVPFRRRFDAAKNPRVLVSLLVTVISCLGAFSAYTFMSPILAATGGLHGAAVSVPLFCYGVGAATGNLLGGRVADRWGARKPLMIMLGIGAVSLALLPLAGTSLPGAAVVLFVWGLSTWAFNPPMQHSLIELMPSAPALVLSLNASAIYLGVGLSGIAGGLVLTVGDPAVLSEFAAVLTMVALLVILLGLRQRAKEVISQSDPGNTNPSWPSVNLTR